MTPGERSNTPPRLHIICRPLMHAIPTGRDFAAPLACYTICHHTPRSLSQGLENAERGPNFYQILGLRRGSSAIEIKRAYRQLSLELHPDKNPSQDAADRFSKMSAALEVREGGREVKSIKTGYRFFEG